MQGGIRPPPSHAYSPDQSLLQPHVQPVVNPQQNTLITPMLLQPVLNHPIYIMLGQVSALVVISLTGFVLASGEIVAVCCLPLGFLLALPGALYAKQKKSDYFMVMGVNPPTHIITWVALIFCVFICIFSFFIGIIQ